MKTQNKDRLVRLLLLLALLDFSFGLYAQFPSAFPASYPGSRANLGLYGGRPIPDLTLCPTNNRLFATVESPVSLFYSDDQAVNWQMAFSVDSLEYNSDQQGWGGGGVQVYANANGWVAVRTMQQGGRLNAAVISFDEGDDDSWKTAMDDFTLRTLIGDWGSVSSIALSDSWLYVGIGNYLTRVRESAPINTSSDIFNLTSYMTGLTRNGRIISLAVSNNSTGFPLYFIIDSLGCSCGQMYTFDGTSVALVTTPNGGDSVMSVLVHPASVTGDTLVINVKTGSHAMQNFISLNGGGAWTDITFADNGYITDFDYSPLWSLPASNDAILLIPGGAISKDLGANWLTVSPETYNDAMAIDPADDLFIFACSNEGLGIVTSTTGPAGPFTLQDNLGFSAVRVRSIERNATKSIFYVATGSGLAYTTVFNDPLIPNYEKWHPPYGEFPVPDAGTGFGTSAVAIDPLDDQHVITGFGEGLAYTMTGPTGFTDVYPTGWHTSPSLFVKDIRFVNSLVVIAVVGGENSEAVDLGDIWRSADGGISWIKVTPTGFNNGNTIAMGVLGTDTVLYVGTGLAVTSLENEGILWGSTDLGLNWSVINYGPTGYNPDGTTITHVPIYDIAVDPRGKDTLYIAGGCNLHYAFDKSIDGGMSYTPITCAVGEGSFSAAVVNQYYPDTIFMAIRRDIKAYDAIGNTCADIYRGFPGELIPDLEFGSLYAGTSTGFYQITSYMVPAAIHDFPSADQYRLILYPNPATSLVHVRFDTEGEKTVRIEIFSSLGWQMQAFTSHLDQSGQQDIQFDGSGLPPGIYVVKYTDSEKTRFGNLVKL